VEITGLVLEIYDLENGERRSRRKQTGRTV